MLTLISVYSLNDIMPSGNMSLAIGYLRLTFILSGLSESIANLRPSMNSASCLPGPPVMLTLKGSPLPKGTKMLPIAADCRPKMTYSPSMDVIWLMDVLKIDLPTESLA